MSFKGNQENEVDDAYLIVITQVKSAGKINECDVYKISAVEFLSLNREPHLNVDERIPEVVLIPLPKIRVKILARSPPIIRKFLFCLFE